MCIVCSYDKVYILNDFGNYSTLRCTNCGAVFTDKVIDSKTYSQTEGFQTGHVPFHKRHFDYIPGNITARFYYNYLKEHIDLTKIKSVLDIGAGRGYFIKLFEDKGIKTRGIEPRFDEVAFSVSKNLQYGFFDENYSVNEKFDIVCLAGVLLFFRDNYRILRKVVSMLNPGGYIFIMNPNADSERVVNHFGKRGTPYNTACILTRKGWIEMVEKIGCGLVDYSFYEPNILFDMYYRRRIFKLIKYLLFPSSGYQRAGEDGYNIMLLLSKKTVSPEKAIL